jgi:hypothetical protein
MTRPVIGRIRAGTCGGRICPRAHVLYAPSACDRSAEQAATSSTRAAPALFRAAAQAVAVAPVVMRSSTSAMEAAGSREEEKVPRRLDRLCSADRPAWSGASIRRSRRGTASSPSSAARRRASSRAWSNPRRRMSRRRPGTQVRTDALKPWPRTRSVRHSTSGAAQARSPLSLSPRTKALAGPA